MIFFTILSRAWLSKVYMKYRFIENLKLSYTLFKKILNLIKICKTKCSWDYSNWYTNYFSCISYKCYSLLVCVFGWNVAVKIISCISVNLLKTTYTEKHKVPFYYLSKNSLCTSLVYMSFSSMTLQMGFNFIFLRWDTHFSRILWRVKN